MRLGTLRARVGKRAAIALVAAGLVATQATIVLASNGRSWTNTNFDHVFVIMMENTGYDALIGNPNAPWINDAAATYGFSERSYGVTHPSQPNYVAITAGVTAVPDDSDYTINAINIVDQLEASGKTWTDYQQSLSLCLGNLLAHSCGDQLYERKHNPFVSFADVQNNPTRMANVVDFSQLATDLANDTVADYSFIAPDQCNDMHGRSTAGDCNYGNVQGLIATGDQFLSDTVGMIMSSDAWSQNSIIFVTWDESDYTGSPTDFGFGDTSGCCTADPGGGHVVTLVISSAIDGARTSVHHYNHYSILGTIQDAWNLGCLGATCDRAKVHRMTDLVNP